MASNRLPRTRDGLLALAENMADGLRAHEAAIGIKQNSEGSMRTDVAGGPRRRLTMTAQLSARTRLWRLLKRRPDSKGTGFIAAAKGGAGELPGRWAESL